MIAWLVAFHLIAAFLWFSGLFYLPRLFKYHVVALRQGDEQGARRFEVMERQLYRVVMNPAMYATLALGLLLAILQYHYVLSAPWFWAKIVLVILLIGCHHMSKAFMRKLRTTQGKPRLFYKIFSMIPPILMGVIVVLAIVQPF